MKNFGAKWLALAVVFGTVAGVSLNGCGGGDGGGPGKGGSTGSAGKGGSGTAGATGQAGRGGTTGSAGSTPTGGRGGTTGTAGATAGTTGTAGTGGTVPSLNCPRATFDTTDEGFVLNMYNNGAGNLFNREAGAKAAAAFEPNQGDPANGSIKIDAPYDDYSQFVDLVKGYSATTLQNWTGATKMHVRVKVASGFNPSASNPAGVMPYVQTTTGFVDCRDYINVVAGNGWNDYVLDFAAKCPATWKASEVIGYGVQLDTGNGAQDGGINPMKPSTAVIYVDSFYLDGTCTGGTGGTGGGAAGTTGTGGGAAGTTGTGGGAAGTGGGTAGTGGGAAGTGGGAAGTGGGAAGTGGGAAGRGGTTGTGGGAAGTGGGAAGTGGAATALYDFESGVQGWAPTTVVSASPDQHLDGAQSLKMTYGVLDGTNIATTIDGPALWPGTVLTFHVFLPVGFDTTGGTYFQAFSQSNNYKLFDTNGNGARTPTAGAWNTWTYTVPSTFPGGLQQLGFQLGDNAAGSTIPAGSVYLDAITATGGTVNCAVATGTGAHTFEPIDGGGLDPMYQKDGSDADTVASQSSDRFNSGTGSWKVAFTALPAPAAGAMTSRRVFINGPNIYCGQIATVHVFLPAGSDNLTFQVFAQYNNYGQFGAAGPATVTRDAWNTYAYTIPSNVGPGGIQRLGVQLIWSGTTAFTGNVYIDDVTW